MNIPVPATATIMIIDDEQLSRDLLKLALESDYRLLFAASGQEALDLLVHEQPDIILLDIMMPDIDGYDVCKKIKANPTLQDIPVLFITCLNEIAEESYGLELGAADYIVKPYNNGIVKLRVKNHLQLKQQRDMLAQHARLLLDTNDQLAMEILERQRIQAEHERVITELRDTALKVNTLSGLLPICSSCKKIRDDNGYWEQIESYLKKHSDVEFSHGLCVECANTLYPDYAPK
jgi:response regulator RpfG family c-di-GMP phosphodiesterase